MGLKGGVLANHKLGKLSFLTAWNVLMFDIKFSASSNHFDLKMDHTEAKAHFVSLTGSTGEAAEFWLEGADCESLQSTVLTCVDLLIAWALEGQSHIDTPLDRCPNHVPDNIMAMPSQAEARCSHYLAKCLVHFYSPLVIDDVLVALTGDLNRAVESYYESMQEDHADSGQGVTRSAPPQQTANLGDLPRARHLNLPPMQ